MVARVGPGRAGGLAEEAVLAAGLEGRAVHRHTCKG